MTTLHVVTLYPYDDGSEARYQFDTPEDAQAFADRVNALPDETLRYVNGEGKPDRVAVWESSTYTSPDEAWAALSESLPDVEDTDE